jgi:hypothetical protein
MRTRTAPRIDLTAGAMATAMARVAIEAAAVTVAAARAALASTRW